MISNSGLGRVPGSPDKFEETAAPHLFAPTSISADILLQALRARPCPRVSLSCRAMAAAAAELGSAAPQSIAAELHGDLPQLMAAAGEAAGLVEEGPVNRMQPLPGCHPLFVQADFVSRMQMPEGWKHGSVDFCLAPGDAIPGAPVSSHEVLKYQEARFSKLKPGETVKWKHAITVVVAEDDASRYDPAAPALRKISMDKVFFVFCYS